MSVVVAGAVGICVCVCVCLGVGVGEGGSMGGPCMWVSLRVEGVCLCAQKGSVFCLPNQSCHPLKTSLRDISQQTWR